MHQPAMKLVDHFVSLSRCCGLCSGRILEMQYLADRTRHGQPDFLRTAWVSGHLLRKNSSLEQWIWVRRFGKYISNANHFICIHPLVNFLVMLNCSFKINMLKQFQPHLLFNSICNVRSVKNIFTISCSSVLSFNEI